MATRTKIDLPDWHADPRLAELERRRDELDRDRRRVGPAVSEAEARLADATATVEPIEVDLLAGVRKDAAALDKARAAVAAADAKLAEARARAAALADEQRKVEAALAIITDEAKVVARRALHAPYRAAIARLDELLMEASKVSDEIFTIWSHAEQQFGGSPETSPRGVSHPSCGGLTRANWHELALPGQQQALGDVNEGRLARWHRETASGEWIADPDGKPRPTSPAPTATATGQRRLVPLDEPATAQQRFIADIEASEGWVGP
ncbi:MAG TPA: hypothetical protein VE011_09755 [Candidatus Dormibacteraeota bacterium]|nr:hypothetical protein [Candidatus Dormibacteraeota bacterium]